MPSTYTPNLGLEEPAINSKVGTWGTTLNTMMALLDSAIEGVSYVNMAGISTYTLTITNGAVSNGRARVIHCTGTPTGNSTLLLLPTSTARVYIVTNAMGGGYSLTVSQGSGASVTIANGLRTAIYADGAGATAAVYSLLDSAQLSAPTITGAISGNPTLPYVDAHVNGNTTISLTGLSTYTLDTTLISTGANALINFTGSAATSPCVVTLSPNNTQKILFVMNNLSLAADFSGKNVQIKQGSGTAVTVAGGNGVAAIIAADGGGSTANCTSLFTQLFQAGSTFSNNQIPSWDTASNGMAISGLVRSSNGTGVELSTGLYMYETCNFTAPTDANISASHFAVWVNESTNMLTFRVRLSGGTYKTGTIALS